MPDSRQSPMTRDAYAKRRANLLARTRALGAIRRFFDDQGVLEVETPVLQVSPGLEPHLMAFETTLDQPLGQGSGTLYLHTSPEFAMKKLLSAGERDIYQMARVFRNGERSATHHPEFSMLEWYRSGFSLSDMMAETESLVACVVRAVGADRLRWNGHTPDPFQPWQRLSVAGAFALYAQIDLLGALERGIARSGNPMEPDAGPLALDAAQRGIVASPEDRFDDVFFRIFLEFIEPNLGLERPTILYGYPLCMAALSRVSQTDPRLADRFEVYIGGLELANAFGELTDAPEQRRRFEADMDVKERLYGTRYPIDEGFLDALEQGLPDCAGIALGFDRLMMVCLGVPRIEDVLWVPVHDPGFSQQ